MKRPDTDFMHEAYRAALAAVGNSDPNPAVGAVVMAPQGEIMARGATQLAGYAHAERFALNKIPGADLSEATLYVTLEPCCHHGRTPPCVDIILERKLRRVVIAERDFAAEVMGRSLQLLQQRGVDVSVLETAAFDREAWLTTGPFFFARKHGRPRITLKWAQTRDGALAPPAGPSGPISGKAAAFVTAALRNLHKFTLATPGAVKSDKPRLNVRFDGSAPDLKSSGLSESFSELLLMQPQLVLKDTEVGQTQTKPAFRGFLASAMNPIERGEFYAAQTGIDNHFHTFPFLPEEWRMDFYGKMMALLRDILQRGYNSILIEAGPEFSELLLEHGLVDALAIYRSRAKTAESLWGKPGRGNSFSTALSQDADTKAPEGFSLMEKADLAEDEFFFFRKSP